MAKRIQVSSDGGTTWYTLPGSSGEKRLETNQVDTTVFGHNYEAMEPTLAQGQITSNAKWRGVAGYMANVKAGGTPTAMTSEAMTLVSGKTYQITASSKRVISWASPVTVYDNAVDATAQVLSIDYLTGKVTFKSTYTPTGPITATGYYVPMSTLAKGRSFNLTQTAAEIDITDYETARTNGGLRTWSQGLKTVALEVGHVFDATNAYATALLARGLVYVQVLPDNTSETMFQGFFKRANHNQSGDVGALETETVNFSLWVPDGDLVLNPFSWTFGSSTAINTAIRKVLEAYQADGAIKVRYLWDGTAGQSADSIVTEASLANSYEGLNEFSATFRVNGALTAVP